MKIIHGEIYINSINKFQIPKININYKLHYIFKSDATFFRANVMEILYYTFQVMIFFF